MYWYSHRKRYMVFYCGRRFPRKHAACILYDIWGAYGVFRDYMNTKVKNPGTHRTHCCVIHGCKYGDSDCPVVNKEVMQEYLCEDCNNDYLGTKTTFAEIEEVFNSPFEQTEPYTVMEKLHVIEENKCIYNIHYCKAGVGISFYYAERDTGNWKEALSTKGYHKDFEACIEAEYKIMLEELWGDVND